MDSINLKKWIDHKGCPVSIKDIMKKTNLELDAVQELIKEAGLIEGISDRETLYGIGSEIEGIYKISNTGPYIDTGTENIDAKYTKALHGQHVKAIRMRKYSLITEIEPKSWVFRIQHNIAKSLDGKIRVKTVENYHDVLALCEVYWKKDEPYAKVKSVIGKSGSSKEESEAILYDSGINPEFSKNALEEIQDFTEPTAKDFEGRRDMRDVITLTIDPADARDHDDAISFEQVDNIYRIGVHIADVSHYIKPGSCIDAEASQRATSIYLVDKVIPMLPEKLSNNLCSLKEGKDRLCLSVIFDFDLEYNIIDWWYGRTVICVDRFFSYEQASETSEQPYREILEKLNDITLHLKTERSLRSIDFDTSEKKIQLQDGKPVKVIPKSRMRTHMIIEDLMLLANRYVGEYLKDKEGIYWRIHPYPDPMRIISLTNSLKGLDIDASINIHNLTEDLQKILTEIKDQTYSESVKSLMIRSMSKAKYSTEHDEHFGLGFKYYVHFTSPIRRYPDIQVHRKLLGYAGSYSELNAQHCSNRELVAAEAERASVKRYCAILMQKEIGRVVKAKITGITDTVLFAESLEHLIEGGILIENMPGKWYKDRKTGVLKGLTILKLGDIITIRVVKSNPEERKIEYEIIFV